MKFENVKQGQVLFTDKYGPHNLRAFFFVKGKDKFAIFGTQIIEGDAYGEWFKYEGGYSKENWKDSEMADTTIANKKQFFKVLFEEMEHIYEE